MESSSSIIIEFRVCSDAEYGAISCELCVCGILDVLWTGRVPLRLNAIHFNYITWIKRVWQFYNIVCSLWERSGAGAYLCTVVVVYVIQNDIHRAVLRVSIMSIFWHTCANITWGLFWIHRLCHILNFISSNHHYIARKHENAFNKERYQVPRFSYNPQFKAASNTHTHTCS